MAIADAPRFDTADHALLSEGLKTGAVGAVAVALWFLLVDTVAGQPLFTPAVLGGIVAGDPDPVLAAEAGSRLWRAALYTPIHFIGFALLGIGATALVHRAVNTPVLLALFFMLFLAVEVAFTGFVAILEQSALGGLAWYQIAAGNLVAVASMGTYLYKRHRGLRRAFVRHFADGDDAG
jgi:hypothetical protein